MPKTYNEIYIALRNKLRDAGVEASALEARLLLAHAADKAPEKLMADLQLYASDAIEAESEALAARRLAGEPAAYILGAWGFYGLDLKVAPGVLIPRSDTEVLVDKALELLRDTTDAPRVLDLCTGSGCIGCAIGHTLPKSRILMADNSAKALILAQENVRQCGLRERAECMELDVRVPPQTTLGSFDMIVSNPPYIAREEIQTLDASVRDYEPREALDGGEDGLDFYRDILRVWTPYLRRAGWMVFEVGETQAQDVKLLMLQAGLHAVGIQKDTADYDRVVFGRL